MRHRGAVFWAWADPSLQHHSHEEMLVDGSRLNVQVRLSRTGDTQLFIGIYERSGLAGIEEAYAKRPGETVTRAMVWGQAGDVLWLKLGQMEVVQSPIRK